MKPAYEMVRLFWENVMTMLKIITVLFLMLLDYESNRFPCDQCGTVSTPRTSTVALFLSMISWYYSKVGVPWVLLVETMNDWPYLWCLEQLRNGGESIDMGQITVLHCVRMQRAHLCTCAWHRFGIGPRSGPKPNRFIHTIKCGSMFGYGSGHFHQLTLSYHRHWTD